MKFIFKILIALLVLTSTASAAPDSVDNLAAKGMPRPLGQEIKDTMIGVDSSGNIVIPVASGKKLKTTVGGTPGPELTSDQFASPVAAPVVTPMTALTPVAAAALASRVSIMATAAPTFAIVTLPAATSNVGKSFGVYNKGASPLLFHNSGVVGTDAINGAGAGTPYSCATTKFCDCRVIGTGNYMCVSQ